jgi:large subunit ribosomal protein L33
LDARRTDPARTRNHTEETEDDAQALDVFRISVSIPHPQPAIRPGPQRFSPMRDQIRLSCSECQRNNYYTNKNKRTTTNKLEFNKFCPWCNKHVKHVEGKMPNPKKQ